MLDQVINSKNRLAIDDQLTAVLEEEADPWGGGPGAYRIAIRDEVGEIYRVITAHGLGEFVRFKERLQALGLSDELHCQKALHGFDAVLSLDR